jgi:hypothetical protein
VKAGSLVRCTSQASTDSRAVREADHGNNAVDRHVIDSQQLPRGNHEAIADQHSIFALVRETAERGRRRRASRRQWLTER